MGDFFSINRFLSYAAKTYRENSRKYMMYGLLVLCAQILMIIMAAMSFNDAPRSFFLIMWMGVILSVLFVFSEMKPIRDSHRALTHNTLPVSHFEKYLLLFVNTTLLFSLVYFAAFFVTSLFSSKVIGFGTMSDFWGDRQTFLRTGRFMLCEGMMFVVIAIFAGTTSIKNHLLAFLTVMFVAVPLLGASTYLPWFINSNFLDGISLGPYFNGLSAEVVVENTTLEYSTVPMFGSFFSSFSGKGNEFYIWSLLLLVVGYFKFRERQTK